MRLVSLNGTEGPTAVCDDIHFGGVELFREGTWGRICADPFGSYPEDFTLDAQVVCRQLGFPFGTLMDAGELGSVYGDSTPDYSDLPPFTIWATEVWAKAPRRPADTPLGRYCCPEALLTCLLHSRSSASLGVSRFPCLCMCAY